MSNPHMHNIIMTPLVGNSTWSVETYQEYFDYISSHDQKHINELVKYTESNQKEDDFLWPVEVGTIQMLAAVFVKDKVIKLASKQLSRELTLINCSERESFYDFTKMKYFASSIAAISPNNSPLSIEFISDNFDLPLFNESKFNDIHQATNELSDQLVEKIQTYKTSLFEKVSNFSLDMIANFMLIRIHVLKFLAILPCLNHDKSGEEVKRIFLETLRRLIADSNLADEKKLKGQKRSLPSFYVKLASFVLYVSGFVPPKALSYIIKKSVQVMAKRFIAGENINNAKRSLLGLMKSNREATIDQLGELVVSKYEANHYTEKVIEVIQGLVKSIPKGAVNEAGINKGHVSIKVTALTHDFKPQDFNYTYECVAPRLIKILLNAKEHDIFVNIDAEHYHYRDCVLKIYEKVLLETEELKDFTKTGIVIQAYLKDAYPHFQQVLALAKKRNILMPIRLVKGAYWDAETIEADAHNFDAPEFINKEETDIHFRQLLFETLKEGKYLQLALASHNIKDHCFSEVVRNKLFPDAPRIEHQCLHMTYEGLSVGMSKLGWTTRNYIPIGDLLVGMAYLVRRIMENSSQVGVLTMMRSHKKSLDQKNPTQNLKISRDEMRINQEVSIKSMSRDFKNIYPIRSYLDHHLSKINNALKDDLLKLGENKLFSESGDVKVLCSSEPELLLGRVSYDKEENVQSKVQTLFSGYMESKWKSSLLLRVSSLYSLADLLLFEREKLISLIMLEAGKTVDEAIADVDESIDFIHFYIRQQIELEHSSEVISKGVVGVIAPWNFPLAIPCGMSVAALAAGNTVLLKPAEQTVLIAQEFLRLARKAGIPSDVFDISLGEAEVGKAIVEHELVNGVVFTGSKQVGELIYKSVELQVSSSKYQTEAMPKFAITEMGGKNAIIVTNNCELDETISGIIYAAFAHAGQKCSAASRIIIDNEIKENFIQRFESAVKDLKVGSSLEHSTLINPLISKEDQLRVKELAKRASDECLKFGGKIIIDRSKEEFDNYCVGPSVFELPSSIVLKEDTVATTEVFGPIIHIIGYKDLDEAIEIFNSTNYALTGGIYCQSQDDIDYLSPQLEAGNLYINRPNTGARVAIEPFGGFKMSGTGPKAGSEEYLSKFNRHISPIIQNNEVNITAKKSVKDYIAQYSKLSADRRRENSLKFIEVLLDQFEVFFGEITEMNKSKISELKDAIIEGSFDLDSRLFPHHYIPGQTNYGVRDMVFGSGCLVDTSTKLSVQLVLDLLINLLVGNGVSIITTNDEIYEKWKLAVEWAYISGFSNFNLSVSVLSEEDFEEFLKEMNLQFCIFSSNKIPDKYKELVLNKEFSEFMIRLFYAGERVSLEDGLRKFTHCRAFAINTMRHGASLELEI